jgi:Do/DeqQ family serine protease
MKIRGIPVLAMLALVFVAGIAAGGLLAPMSGRADTPAPPPAAAAPAVAAEDETLPDVIDRVSPSVVYITSKKVVKTQINPFYQRFFNIPSERIQKALGSGVIVSGDGYILTNNHLVGGATDVRIHLVDGREFDADIVGADPRTDVAVIKIKGDDLPAMQLGSSAALRLGETVIAIGYPLGLDQTVTKGIVSAKGRALPDLVQLGDFIQTDAAINPGNSGGALINTHGELIGINAAIASQSGGSEGIGFAIPIDLASSIMHSLITEGKVVRGYLGVIPQPVTADMVDLMNLPDTKGTLIGDVAKDTPAEKAGIERGDVIVEFDGKKIESTEQFRLLAADTKPGTKVPVTVIRDGKRKELKVTMGEFPENEAVAENEAQEISPLFLGVGLQNLTDDLRQQLEIPDDVDGVIVTDVQQGTPGGDAGLRRGDVIVELNHTAIGDLGDLRKMMDGYDRGMVLVVVYRDGRYFYTTIRE